MASSTRPALQAGSFLVAILWGVLVAAAAATAPVHYTLDASRSLLRFAFVQAGANNTGRFGKFTTDVLFAADNLAASRIDVTVDITSLDTGDKDRDDTLKGADLFDVKKFPQAHFLATKFTATGGGRYEAGGKLTIRNVTHDFKIPLTFQNKLEDGKNIGYLTGRALIKRLEYGVGQGDWKSTEWVPDEVNVTFSLRLVPG
jgi:polyisoprenoid-binding protein YceI